MKQSRKMSLTESAVRTLLSFCVFVGSNMIVMPWYGYAVTWHQSAEMVAIFTCISFALTYVVRRGIEWGRG